MSFSKLTTLVAAFAATFALSTVAYGDPGKSPNGPPGPAGNPNQEQPQAAPQSQGKSDESQGKSDESHGKSDQAQSNAAPKSKGKKHSAPAKPKSNGNHANPNVGTPRKGGREDRPAGKITICHATKSTTNPYVEITISVNGLHGHGPAEDPHHHDGSWKDIIPAPAGGCPSTVPEQSGTTDENKDKDKDHGKVTICHATGSETNPYVEITIAQAGWDNGHSKHADDLNPVPEGGCPGTTPAQTTTELPKPNDFVAPQPEVAVTAPATTTDTAAPADQQGVLGVRAEGGNAPASDTAPADSNKVLGVQAAGGNAPTAATAPAAAEATRKADTGSLPFTGFELAIVLMLAAGALMAGFALKRASRQDG